MSTGHDPYSSDEATQALLVPDTRSDAVRRLDAMMAERGADEQGAEAYMILRKIALDLIEARPTFEGLRQAIEQVEQACGVAAHRLLRETVDGEWKHNGRPWVDGPPSKELVADAAARGVWRIEYAYTTPLPRNPLTDEQVKAIASESAMWGTVWETDFIHAATAIIRKTETAHNIREKNT